MCILSYNYNIVIMSFICIYCIIMVLCGKINLSGFNNLSGGMKVKKIILGMAFVASLVLASVSFASTASYTALKASFKVLVNGTELKSDKPIVTINGTTYLPLSAVGKALNVNASWNAKLKRVEIGKVIAPRPDVDFTNIIVKENYGMTTVEGEVKNNLSKNISFSLKVSFYDANKKLLGSASGYMSGLKSGETKTFSASAMEDYTNYASYKIQIDNSY